MGEKLETEKNEKPKKKRFPMVFVAPLFLALVFIPTTMLFITMMLPTAIAYIIDKNRPRTLTTTVGTLNFSGTLAVWFELISRGHTLENTQIVVTELDSLLIGYGSAVLGYFIYMNIVPMVARISSRAAEVEKNRIQRKQDALIEIWGPEVTGKAGAQK